MSGKKTTPPPAAPTDTTTEGTPPATTPDSDTITVKIKRSHPDYGYHPGETGELPTEKANAMIEGGFAEAVTPQTDETR